MVRLWWITLLGLCACATNPYGTASDKSAHVLGKRAIVTPDGRGKEFVYFMQLNKIDLRDRWGDYPHDIIIPAGNNKLLVVCEWYGMLSPEPYAKAVKQVKQRFYTGHEYQFRSAPTGEGMCETSFVDVTVAEQTAEVEQKIAAEKAVQAAEKVKVVEKSSTEAKAKATAPTVTPAKSIQSTSKPKKKKKKRRRGHIVDD